MGGWRSTGGGRHRRRKKHLPSVPRCLCGDNTRVPARPGGAVVATYSFISPYIRDAPGETSMTLPLLAALMRIGIQLGLAGTTLRDPVVRRIGDPTFRGVFPDHGRGAGRSTDRDPGCLRAGEQPADGPDSDRRRAGSRADGCGRRRGIRGLRRSDASVGGRPGGTAFDRPTGLGVADFGDGK